MKYVTKASAAFTAVLAMCAVAASTAAAVPAFVGESSVKVRGTTFTSKSGTVKLEGTQTITCPASKGTGEITAPVAVGKVVITFTGCESSGKKCKSPGASTGEIKTVSLKGLLGEVASSEAASGVGESLEPESGSAYMEIESCTSVKTSITGSTIGEVSPTGKLATSDELIYKESSKKQRIKKFKGESGTRELSGLGSVGIEVSNTVTFSKGIEVGFFNCQWLKEQIEETKRLYEAAKVLREQAEANSEPLNVELYKLLEEAYRTELILFEATYRLFC
jgi:hypothetical protein